MKIILKLMQGIGVMAMMIGGGAMDSESLIIPCILAFGGIGVAYLGWRIEEYEYVSKTESTGD